MSAFVLILPLLYYWPFGGSAFVLSWMSEKAKNNASNWFHRKLSLLEKLIVCNFYDSHGYIRKNHSTHKFCVDSRYDFCMFKRRCQKNAIIVGVGRMKTKTICVLFSNARSILELMLCNWNLTSLVYQTLLSFDSRA